LSSHRLVAARAVVAQDFSDQQPAFRGHADHAGLIPSGGDGAGDVGPVAVAVAGTARAVGEIAGLVDRGGEIRMVGIDPGVEHGDSDPLPASGDPLRRHFVGCERPIDLLG
jgi:hypothetical protein